MSASKRNIKKMISTASAVAILVPCLSLQPVPANAASTAPSTAAASAEKSLETTDAPRASLTAEAPELATLTEKVAATYDDVFKISRDQIKSIVANGGQYGNSAPSFALDGNPQTHWEAGKNNKSDFKNNLTVTFDDAYELSHIEFLPRQAGSPGKGFPLKYNLYYSDQESDKDMKLLTTGYFKSGSTVLTRIDFPDTKIRTFRFEFVEAKEDWASLAELSFYKPDPFMVEFDKMFTDKTYTKLSPPYNSKAAVEQVKSMAANHPSKNTYIPLLNDALSLVNDPNKFSNRVFTGEQKGNSGKEADRTQMDGRTSLSSTGYYVLPGETITVYLDADTQGIMPKLVFFQALTNPDASEISRSYALKPGTNIIKAPPLAIKQEFGKMRPAAIYLDNPAYPDQQAYAPKFRLVGGTKFPLYIHGKTDPNEFLKELTAYVSNVENNDTYFDYDKVTTIANPKYYNLAEFVSDHATVTTSARGALATLNQQQKKGLTVKDSMDNWERFVKVMNEYSGLYENDPNPLHRPGLSRLMSRVFTAGPYAWAGRGITGYNAYGDPDNDPRAGGLASEVISVSGPGGGWGVAHEWGHMYDNHNIEIAEMTNNLYSLRMQREFGITSRITSENRWKTIQNFNEGKEQGFSVFEQTASLNQLEYKYGLNDFYPKVNRFLREKSNEGYFKGTQNQWQRMAIAMSQVAQVDLTPHFKHYGFGNMDLPKVQELVKGLPVLKDKTWLITDKSAKTGSFKNNTKPTIASIGRFQTGLQLKLEINEPSDTVLCYEIYRDGKLLGITYGNEYLDTTAAPDNIYEYQVIAYDGKAVASPASDKYMISGKNKDIFSSEWTYTSDPAAQGAYPLKNAFDRNTGTFFESLKPVGNKSVTIDMKKEFYVQGFSYVARPQDQYDAGMVKTFNFYASSDGKNWSKVISNGTMPNPAARGNNYNNISLDKPVKARYVKFESLSILHGDTALAIAELNISGSEKMPVNDQVTPTPSNPSTGTTPPSNPSTGTTTPNNPSPGTPPSNPSTGTTPPNNPSPGTPPSNPSPGTPPSNPSPGTTPNNPSPGSGNSSSNGSISGKGSTVSTGSTGSTGNTGSNSSQDVNLVKVEPVQVSIVKGDNGVTNEELKVNNADLDRAIEKLGSSTSQASMIQIPVQMTDNKSVNLELPASSLVTAAQQLPNAIISITSEGSSLQLPVSAIAFNNVTSVYAKIEKSSASLSGIVGKAKQKGLNPVGSPFEIGISVGSGARSVPVDSFGKIYATSTITLDQMVEPSKATAVSYDAKTGEFAFIPSVFTTDANGKTKVEIKQNGSSQYVIVEAGKTFSDLGGHWAKHDIESLSSKGLIKGMTDSEFDPDAKLTRAQFSKILVEALGLKPEASNGRFSDVKSGNWFDGYVGSSVKAGLVSGYDNGSFQPNANVTREQMAVMVANAIQFAGKSKDVSGHEGEILNQFSDASKISSWSKNAAAMTAELGLTAKVMDSAFQPSKQATRAEAAVFVKNMLVYIEFINKS